MPKTSRYCLFAGLAVASLAFAQEPQKAPDKAPTFDVLEYRVLGNTVLPASSIERAVYAKVAYGF